MILMYHKVDIVTPTMWWVTPADLDRQLDALRDRTFVYLDDYVAAERHVAITFDDAYENVVRHALPVLRAHGVPFEVFVIGDRLGGWNEFDLEEPNTRHMARDHLAEVVEAGGRLQWHTRTHPNLRELAVAEIADELTMHGFAAGGVPRASLHLVRLSVRGTRRPFGRAGPSAVLGRRFGRQGTP